MARLASVAVMAIAACSAPATEPVRPQPAASGAAPAGATRAVPADAGASQEEQLAAIQKAMNELDEAAQGCWAAAAVERMDIEGELTARVDIGEGTATVLLVQDTARSPRLASCVTEVMTRYPWAPPLAGQTIQLPFRFRAPAGQNVIDRTLVPWHGQGGASVAVLIDDANTGNDAASMLELALKAGATTELRIAERTELWYFLGPAAVAAPGGVPQAVAAGDMMYVPRGGAREVRAPDDDVHAVVVLVPGGHEGAARAGALPTPPAGATRRGLPGPRLLPAAAAKTFGPATIHAEPATTKDPALAGSVLRLRAGAAVPEHAHPGASELLYVLEGAGTMTVGGVQLAVTPSSVIQIPPGVLHAFTAAADVRAVQIYTPAGPEQRFKK